MTRNLFIATLLILSLLGLSGCSSEPAKETKKAVVHDTIQGKIQTMPEANASDAAFNAGGPSVYLWEGVRRYRLFLKSPLKIESGKVYTVEGVYAQKLIDEIGDPAQGKNGYPLQESCAHVVRTAWPGQSFDAADSNTSALRTLVKRYPARPVFLVTKVTPAPDAGKKDEEDLKEVSVPAEKQKALLTEGTTTLPAPLWEPAGGTAKCKVLIGKDGKIEELDTGNQLCEAVPWAKFKYQPPVEKGKPVKVKTEVEVTFESRKQS